MCEGFQKQYWNKSRMASLIHASDSIAPQWVLINRKVMTRWRWWKICRPLKACYSPVVSHWWLTWGLTVTIPCESISGFAWVRFVLIVWLSGREGLLNLWAFVPCDMCFCIYAASCDSSLLMAMISGHLFLMPYLSGKGTDCSFYLRLCVGLEKRGSDKTFFFFFFFSSVGITVLFLFLFNQSFFVPLFSFLDFFIASWNPNKHDAHT